MHPNRSIPLFLLLNSTVISAAAQSFALDSEGSLTLHNTEASQAVFKGRKALKVVTKPGAETGDHLAIAPGVEFSNGTIELDLAGEPAPGAGAAARGFVGIAFRVQADRKTYDCFYVRPTNGRADDQERRNHSVQYISHPDYPWFRLRKEFPSRYESYADMMPAEWIHLKVEVNGDKARLYVNNAPQPVLIVNDVKTGLNSKGAVALWLEGSTIAHFANLKVSAAGPSR